MSEQQNPFTTRAVHKKEKFIGRENEVNFILDYIFRKENLSIRGERRIGKTSLLKYICNNRKDLKIPDEIIVVFFEKFENTKYNDIWNLLYHEIISAMSDLKNTQLQDVTSVAQFNAFIKQFSIMGYSIAFLFDEFDQTAKNDELSGLKQSFFYKELRSLSQLYDNISYIITTRLEMYNLEAHDEISSPFFNIFDNYTLTVFTENEAKELIQAYTSPPLSNVLMEEMDFLYEHTGYFPYFFQTLCKIITREYNQKKTIDKNAILKDYNKNCQSHFKYYWTKGSMDDEKEAIALLLQRYEKTIEIKEKDLEKNPDIEKLNPGLEELINRQMIIQHNNSYRFFSAGFKNVCIEEIKKCVEEIKKNDQKNKTVRRKKILENSTLFSIVLVIFGFFYFTFDKYQNQHYLKKMRYIQTAIHYSEKYKPDNSRHYLYLLEALKIDPSHGASISQLQKQIVFQYKESFSDIYIHNANSRIYFWLFNKNDLFNTSINTDNMVHQFVNHLSTISHDFVKTKHFINKIPFPLEPEMKTTEKVLAFSHNNQYMAISNGKKIVVYEVSTLLLQSQKIYSYELNDPVKSLVFSPDESLLAILTYNNKAIHILSFSEKELQNIDCSTITGVIDQINFFANQTMIISSSSGMNEANLYYADLNQDTLSVEKKYISSKKISKIVVENDRKILACGHTNGDISILALNDGNIEMKSELVAHTDIITDLSFSCDDQYLISVGNYQMIYLWDLRQPENIPVQLIGHTMPVIRVYAINNWFITAALDKCIRFWPVHTDLLMNMSCQLLKNQFKDKGCFLSQDEWKKSFEDRSYQRTCP